LGRRYLLMTSSRTNTIMNDCINLDTGNLSSIPIPCNKRQQSSKYSSSLLCRLGCTLS
jgi:hypothetical protein